MILNQKYSELFSNMKIEQNRFFPNVWNSTNFDFMTVIYTEERFLEKNSSFIEIFFFTLMCFCKFENAK